MQGKVQLSWVLSVSHLTVRDARETWITAPETRQSFVVHLSLFPSSSLGSLFSQTLGGSGSQKLTGLAPSPAPEIGWNKLIFWGWGLGGDFRGAIGLEELWASLVLRAWFPLPQNTFVTHAVKGSIVELSLTPGDSNGVQWEPALFPMLLVTARCSSPCCLGVFALTWLSLQGDQWAHWKPCWTSLFLPDVQIPNGLGRKEFSVHASVFVSLFSSYWMLCCSVVLSILIGVLWGDALLPSLREKKREPIKFLLWPRSGHQGLVPHPCLFHDSF